MLGGIVFQMGSLSFMNDELGILNRRNSLHILTAAISVYVALAVEFVLRFLYDRPVRKMDSETDPKRFVDQKTKLMLFGLGLSSLFIFIR